MWIGRCDTYREHFAELAGQGIWYIPMVLSCYGRWHTDAAVTMERLALQAARRQGVRNDKPLLRRARAAVGAALVTRAVAMARACLPRLDEEALQLLYGERATGDDYCGEGVVD